MGEIADKLVEKRLQEAAEKAVHECKVDIAKKLIINGMLIMGVAECTELPLEEVQELWNRIEEEMIIRETVYKYNVGVAKKLIANENLTIEEVADYSGLSVEEVRELQAQLGAEKTSDA